MKTREYTYRVTWSPEDKEYVGLCAEFPSLSWLARTRGQAIAGIRRAVRAAVKDMEAAEEPLPTPSAASGEPKRPLAAVLSSLRGSIALPSGVTAKSLIEERSLKIPIVR